MARTTSKKTTSRKKTDKTAPPPPPKKKSGPTVELDDKSVVYGTNIIGGVIFLVLAICSVISYFNTEGDFQTLPIYIFGMTKRTVTPDIYSLSTLLFVSVLLLLILSNIMQGHAERKEEMRRRATAGGARKRKGGASK